MTDTKALRETLARAEGPKAGNREESLFAAAWRQNARPVLDELDTLRADLARVTAERDELKVERDAMRAEVPEAEQLLGHVAMTSIMRGHDAYKAQRRAEVDRDALAAKLAEAEARALPEWRPLPSGGQRALGPDGVLMQVEPYGGPWRWFCGEHQSGTAPTLAAAIKAATADTPYTLGAFFGHHLRRRSRYAAIRAGAPASPEPDPWRGWSIEIDAALAARKGTK